MPAIQRARPPPSGPASTGATSARAAPTARRSRLLGVARKARRRAPRGAAPVTAMMDVSRSRSGRGGSLDLLYRLALADGDGAGLEALGHVAHEVDVQEAVLQVGTLYLDVVGQLEAALEAARG